jgi:Resolvase, N terminal domain
MGPRHAIDVGRDGNHQDRHPGRRDIRVLDRGYIDLESPIGRGFMAMFSALAEDERRRIIKRTHEGRRISQARGVKIGRRERLNEKQKAEVRRRLAAGETAAELAPLYGVSRPTMGGYVTAERATDVMPAINLTRPLARLMLLLVAMFRS